MMYIITARVDKNYGHANAIIGVAETRKKSEELLEKIHDSNYPLCYDDIDGYSIMNPKIIEVEKLNTLCVCLDEDGLDYSDD